MTREKGHVSRRSFLGVAGATAALGVGPFRSSVAQASTMANASVESIETDVAVIGGGLSGLVAARALVRSGQDVVILEARDAPGGRAHLDGSGADAATAPMAVEQRRLLALATELGLTVRESMNDGKTVDQAGGRIRHVSPGEWAGDSRVATEVVAALGRLDRLASEIDVARPWDVANAPLRDGRSLEQWIDTRVLSAGSRTRLTTLFEVVWGAAPGEISLLHALVVAAGAGGMSSLVQSAAAPSLQLDGGLGHLASVLAAPLSERIRTGCAVTRIHLGDSVRAEAQVVVVEARRAVIAVPLGLIGALEFSPELPSGRTHLARCIRRGSFAVAVCEYGRPFWRDDGLSGRAVSDEGAVALTNPVRAETGEKVFIVARISGRRCRDWEALAPGDRRAAVLTSLREWFGAEAEQPLTYSEHSWATPAWIGGGWSAVAPPGAWLTSGATLRARHPLVAWAGSETALSWPGFPDGSLDAGARAAAEILGSPRDLGGVSVPQMTGRGR